MKILNFFLAALPLTLLIGCGEQQTPQATTQDKKAELCTNLARLNTSVAALKSMSPNSTVGDFRKAQDAVKASFDAVKTSTQTVKEAKTSDLDAAYANLDKAMRAVPNNLTLQQARQSVTPQITAVEQAQATMRAGLSCS